MMRGWRSLRFDRPLRYLHRDGCRGLDDVIGHVVSVAAAGGQWTHKSIEHAVPDSYRFLGIASSTFGS
jgi:hypothetical protein